MAKQIVVTQDDQGAITVAVDGGQPTPVKDEEEALYAVAKEIVAPQGDAEDPQENAAEGGQEEPGEAAGQFEQGFGSVRGQGLNGQGGM